MEHLKNQKVEKLFFFFENEIKILKKKGGGLIRFTIEEIAQELQYCTEQDLRARYL